MASEEDWLSFSGFRGLSKWLLDTVMGRRFVAWFVRRHYKKLLATDWGFEFFDWIMAKAAGDLQGRSPMVVVELSPDLVKSGGCHVRVFGSMRFQVVFVDRLVVPNDPKAEALDLQLAFIKAPLRARGVYQHSKYLLKSHTFEPIGVAEYQVRELERDVIQAIGRPAETKR